MMFWENFSASINAADDLVVGDVFVVAVFAFLNRIRRIDDRVELHEQSGREVGNGRIQHDAHARIERPGNDFFMHDRASGVGIARVIPHQNVAAAPDSPASG